MILKKNNTTHPSKERASSTPYRILALILTFSMLLALGLCACSGKSTETTKKKKKSKKTTKETIETTSEPDDDPSTSSESDKEPSDTSESDLVSTPKDDPTTTSEVPPVVGISLPTDALKRWSEDGDLMKMQLISDGYPTDLQFAANNVASQQAQIEDMINKGCKVLIIAPIDGYALNNALELAKEKNVVVIAYDRLIYRSDAVTYYVSFDNYLAGALQGEYIRTKLDLDNAEGPFNMEIFTGDPSDSNAKLFYEGAMSVLKPYIDSGKLIVKSGQIDFLDVATDAWRTEIAQNRMEAILATHYADGSQLDAVLCSNDSTALGAENALISAYTGKYPVITGQDCDILNVRNILSGYQSMSVFKDTRESAKAAVTMVEEILSGNTVTINDTNTYNNDVIDVPSFLAAPIVVDETNYEEVLIDSGYYTKTDLS